MWQSGCGALALSNTRPPSARTRLAKKALPSLTAEDLKEIGVGPVGHRRTLLEAIAALRCDEEHPHLFPQPSHRMAAHQLHPPHASMGKPSPHGLLGTAGGPPAPAPELPPPELPLDAELLVPLLVVVPVDAPVSLQYVGSWVQI